MIIYNLQVKCLDSFKFKSNFITETLKSLLEI